MKLFAPKKTNTDLIDMILRLYNFYLQTEPFDSKVEIHLIDDVDNSNNILGKTAHYAPYKVTLFISGRHAKDILRSLSHELTHHWQYCQGKYSEDDTSGLSQDYAQNNDKLRKIEREAYEKGNMIFRDWEDDVKSRCTSS